MCENDNIENALIEGDINYNSKSSDKLIMTSMNSNSNLDIANNNETFKFATGGIDRLNNFRSQDNVGGISKHELDILNSPAKTQVLKSSGFKMYNKMKSPDQACLKSYFNQNSGRVITKEANLCYSDYLQSQKTSFKEQTTQN
jgi:hypothetical protein